MKSLKRTVITILALCIYATLFNSCGLFSEECEECTPAAYLSEPAKIISIKQAKDMYDIYTKRKVPALRLGAVNPELNINEDGTVTTAPGFKPTRYVEYSLEEMKHYLAYIENEADLAGVTVDNLRIYFGAYPNEGGTFPNGDVARYNRQESIFIVPTAEAPNGKQKGFYTSGDADGGKRFPVFMQDIQDDLNGKDGKRERKGKRLGKRVSEASMFNFSNMQDDDDRSLVMNNGNVIPPPKQNTDMGDSDDDDDDDDSDNEDIKD